MTKENSCNNLDSKNRTQGSRGKLPINEAGLVSYSLMLWMSELIVGVYRNRHRSLSQEDLWECSEDESISLNTKRMQRLWNKELTRNGDKASFYNVWMRFTFARSMFGLFLLVVNIVSCFAVGGIVLKEIVAYLESEHTRLSYGIGLVIAAFISEMIRAVSIHDMEVYCSQTGTRFRSGVMGMVYGKLLKMKNLNGETSSEILNVFSVDSQRVYMATCTSIAILSLPFYLVIGTVYCYVLIGSWGFLAVGTLIICYFIQRQLAKYIGPIRIKSVKYADQRIQRMREVIHNIKFIKMYNWEKPLSDAIEGIRKLEKKYLEQSAMLICIISAFIPIIPTVAAVVTISLYAATGNKLNASTIFAVVGTMNCLRGMTARIPPALKMYAEAKVSFKRIQKLLLTEEYISPSTKVINTENDIEIKGADFVYETTYKTANVNHLLRKDTESKANDANPSPTDASNDFELTDISFEAKQGQLIGVSGPVGCGKSSLMLAILGRLEMTKGHLAVNGRVAYVPQHPWIFNASIKENILFGSEFDLKRYNDVVKSCCLNTDISLMVDGHNTEIGERGTNLSGGQKQRVSLARAVYSNRDIYILDDPLSALDIKVGEKVFQECIQGLLSTKTVLLVTHHLEKLKYCDEVAVMENGTIVQQGKSLDVLDLTGLIADNGNNQEQISHNDEKGIGYLDKNKSKLIKNGVMDNLTGTVENGEKDEESRAFVRAESSAVGDIKFGTYRTYIDCAGGWCVINAIIGLFVISSAIIMLAEWWLSEWITSDNVKTLKMCQSQTENVSVIGNISSVLDLERVNQSNYISNDCISHESMGFFRSISRNTYLIVFVFTLAVILILQLVKSIKEAKGAVRASDELHSRCLERVLSSTMSFFDSTPVGRILNRFSKDLDECDALMPHEIYRFLDLSTRFVMATVISVYVSPWFLIAVVPIILFYYILKQISFVAIRELKRFENTSRSPLLSDVNATTMGLFSVVAYEQQEQFLERAARFGNMASMASLLFNIGVRWIAVRLDLIAGFMTVTASLICVFTKGHILPASAGLILSMCGKMNATLQYLLMHANQIEAHFTAVERICEYIEDLEPEPQGELRDVSPHWPQTGRVTFSNVTMRYRKDQAPVLRSVSFEVYPKEKVGVVGRTGAGKSSLIAAILRLVELESGMITIDDEDISKISLNVLRSKIATISQEPVLFSGTLRYNIDPFNIYSDDEIWSALEKINMKYKIQQLNEGLEAMVEEQGRNFSVGECQLLCLARAVLRKSKILLLDEATANIDTATDAMIQETINKCFVDCTVITIAHRLNTVLHSDKIIVLDCGQVIEYGSPNDLLADHNSYLSSAKMIINQSQDT